MGGKNKEASYVRKTFIAPDGHAALRIAAAHFHGIGGTGRKLTKKSGRRKHSLRKTAFSKV